MIGRTDVSRQYFIIQNSPHSDPSSATLDAMSAKKMVAPMGNQSDAARAKAAWEALLVAHSVLLRNFDSEHIWTDVSMHEYDVLHTLRLHHGPMRMRSLSDSVLLSQPGLSRLVDRLVARGLVRRHKDPEDGRGVLVELTDDGRAVQRRIDRSRSRSVADAVMRALSGPEQEELRALCTKLGTPPPQA
jgi:DNA-binding MarR family transcriptional regulator